MKHAFTLAAWLAFTLAFFLDAAAADHAGMQMDTMAAKPAATEAAIEAAGTTMSSGVVKKIDKDAGKLTIKHGPLINLHMPGMTMVFRVADSVMLDQVKAGDKIDFVAEKKNGMLTVTKMEAAR